jgi:CRP-like cAMP-binding protein
MLPQSTAEEQKIFEILQQFGDFRTNENLDVLHEFFMRTNTFFQDTMRKKDDRFELNRLYKKLNLEFYEKNSLIIREGDIGDKFYIIIRGTCAVLNKGIREETY